MGSVAEWNCERNEPVTLKTDQKKLPIRTRERKQIGKQLTEPRGPIRQ